MSSAVDILQKHAKRVDQALDQLLNTFADAPPRLIESMRYSLSAGGKRLRPALVLETFCSLSPDQSLDDPDLATPVRAACAMELIHTFSLVHDDLPAMDDDDFRRGKPTNHKVFGQAMAILAGDAMIALAFELLAASSQADLVPALTIELARATGATGMIGGQVLDIAAENQRLDISQLQQIHRMKTGALLTASCRIGAICANAKPDFLNCITRFGQHIGLAFQIVDDLLDETSTPQQLGKATQKDRQKGKNTYPALLGLDPSRQEADRQLDLAIQSLDPIGPHASGLITLAEFVVNRHS